MIVPGRKLLVAAFGGVAEICEGSWSLAILDGAKVCVRDLGHSTKESAMQAARCELQHVAHEHLVLFGPDGFQVRIPKPRKVRP